jgi:hypothetical protein
VVVVERAVELEELPTEVEVLDKLDRMEDEGCVVVLEEVTELDGLPLGLVEVLKELEEVESEDCALVGEEVEGLLLGVEVETTTLLVEED